MRTGEHPVGWTQIYGTGCRLYLLNKSSRVSNVKLLNERASRNSKGLNRHIKLTKQKGLGNINSIKKIYNWIVFGVKNSLIVRDPRLMFSCVISKKLPRSVSMPHPVGVVIGSDSPIGNNCTIMQNVTIGVRNIKDNQSPTIGDDVLIGAGAAVLGDIKVGDGAKITANSVVLSDVPAETTVAGIPAKTVNPKHKKSNG